MAIVIPEGKKKISLSGFFNLLKETTQNFFENDNMKYSAALSYYTVFSIAPMLIIAIGVGSIIFGDDAIKGHLFKQINGIVGNEAAEQIQSMLSNVTLRKNNIAATVIGIITVFFGATGVFGEIQSTINKIWGLKAKPKKGIIRYILNRSLSFAMVITLGFILIVSLVASTIISLLNEKLNTILPDTTFIIIVINNLVALSIITVLFSLIFKFLPDSKVRWKDALIGSIFTSALFLIGKYLIGLYLSSSSTTGAFGAAGSIVILLLWVYYSSILLYFGAEFTKSYAMRFGNGIQPSKFSMLVIYRTEPVEGIITSEQLKEKKDSGNENN